MNRKQSITVDAEDVPSTFGQTKPPSGSADSEIIQIRILAPKDVGDKIAEAMQPLGLSVSGSQPEEGYENRHRTYLVSPVKIFRKVNGLAMVSVTPTLDKPTPPTESKEGLAKRKQELSLELTKAQVAEHAALNGTDPKTLTEAKQHVVSIREMLGHIMKDEEAWRQYDRDLEDYEQFTATASEVRHHQTTDYVCASCGGPLTFLGPMNGTTGLSFHSNDWMKSKVANSTYLISLDCPSCNSRVLKSPKDLRALELEQRGQRPSKRRIAKMKTWPQ